MKYTISENPTTVHGLLIQTLIHTQKRAADVLRDLVAGLGLGEVAELLVEHALELQRKRERKAV